MELKSELKKNLEIIAEMQIAVMNSQSEYFGSQ
jgi:hypothetical protein